MTIIMMDQINCPVLSYTGRHAVVGSRFSKTFRIEKMCFYGKIDNQCSERVHTKSSVHILMITKNSINFAKLIEITIRAERCLAFRRTLLKIMIEEDENNISLAYSCRSYTPTTKKSVFHNFDSRVNL